MRFLAECEKEGAPQVEKDQIILRFPDVMEIQIVEEIGKLRSRILSIFGELDLFPDSDIVFDESEFMEVQEDLQESFPEIGLNRKQKDEGPHEFELNLDKFRGRIRVQALREAREDADALYAHHHDGSWQGLSELHSDARDLERRVNKKIKNPENEVGYEATGTSFVYRGRRLSARDPWTGKVITRKKLVAWKGRVRRGEA